MLAVGIGLIRIENESHYLENCNTCKKIQIRINSMGKRFDKFPFS